MNALRFRAVLRVASIFTFAAGAIVASPAASEKLALKKVGEYHMPTGRYGAAAVVSGDSIYIVGGAEYGATPDIVRFDTRTHEMERLCDQLLPRRFHGAVEFKGHITIIGGQGFRLPLQAVGLEPAVEVFDLATHTLSRGKELQNPRYNAAIVRLGDKVIVTGGARVKNAHLTHTNETDIYDLTADTWTKGLPMPTPREAQGVRVDNFIIVAGGYRGTARVANVEFFVPQEEVWKTLPPLAEKVSAHSVAVLGKYLLLFGDYSNPDSLLAYDLTTRATLKVQANFAGGRHSTAVVCNGVVYVIGGTTDGAPPLDLIQAFTL